MSENEESTPGEAADAEADPESRESEPAPESDSETAAAADAAEASASVDEDLVERVADTEPEAVAREIAGLRERAERAEDALLEKDDRIEELESKLKRKQADFQNFKKRMERKREEEKARATEDLVDRMLEVRDNLVRALSQDEDTDIRPGVEKTLDQFDRVLDAENVQAIEPGPGAEVDPQRHEVLLRVASDQPEGTVDDLQRPGYEMAEKVLRPAQVTVSDGSDAGDDEA